MRPMRRDRGQGSAAQRTRRVFLHIGAPMAGAAYLRDGLARHRRRLTRCGVLYPASHLGHDGGHLDAVLDVLDLAGADPAPSDGAWDRLAETSRDWRRGTVVVSHELLADATEDQVERVVASFGGVEVHVVYAARGLGSQIPLAWQEWVRNGGTAPFAGYVNRVVARDPHRMSRVFWASHDIAAVLHRWSTFVPSDRVHLLTVPAGEDQDAVLWDRFARTVGIDPRRFAVGVDRHRELLGLAENEVLRLLNVEAGRQAAACAGAGVGALERVRRTLGPGTVPAMPDVPAMAVAPALPDVHADWLSDEADRQAGAVEDSGYHVVGDVTELRAGPDVFARDEAQVTPPTDGVVAAQTRALAAAAGVIATDEGPAGVRRRALRRLRSTRPG